MRRLPRRHDIEAFVAAGVDIIRLWPEWISADSTLIRKVRRLGKPVWVTAGDASLVEIERLLQLGIDGILSDSPALVSKVAPDARARRSRRLLLRRAVEPAIR